MIIYLVRHGKDYEEYRGGWSNLGLIKEGVNQSKKLAEHLYNNKDKYNINTLASSDLSRTVETVNEISAKLNMPVKFCEEWREINNGLLAGMLNTEALHKYPGLYFNTLQMDERYPGGESPIEFYYRIKNAYEKLCDEILNGEIGPNVMLVTHGGVIKVIYYMINGLDWTNKSAKLCKSSNTGIHSIEYILGEWKIIDSNNIEHLNNLVI
ncbi:histidine phosphatase family protein [Clostridium sp. UBA4548]|uniref:histidine phosphatase family protein n=1 Tax=Clostridium sp. UBA4548 TaxID=1946361 RepID=UPI0025C10C4C|nr:histidine phosphatase family protein [Clostridium sp. UBA4548]